MYMYRNNCWYPSDVLAILTNSLSWAENKTDNDTVKTNKDWKIFKKQVSKSLRVSTLSSSLIKYKI